MRDTVKVHVQFIFSQKRAGFCSVALDLAQFTKEIFKPRWRNHFNKFAWGIARIPGRMPLIARFERPCTRPKHRADLDYITIGAPLRKNFGNKAICVQQFPHRAEDIGVVIDDRHCYLSFMHDLFLIYVADGPLENAFKSTGESAKRVRRSKREAAPAAAVKREETVRLPRRSANGRSE